MILKIAGMPMESQEGVSKNR